jgi:hypothetical protein
MSPQRSRLRLQWLRDVSSLEGMPWTRQGTIRLSSYLHHEHSKVLFDAVLPCKAEDGTGQYPQPRFMEPSAADVHTSLIISSYDAAHVRNAWDTSYMSPPGRIRSPNRACSRRWRRSILMSWGIDKKTTSSNRGIATSPHPQSEPDKTYCSCAVKSSIRSC